MNSQREDFEKWFDSDEALGDLFAEEKELHWLTWQAATEQGVGEVVATEVKPISQAAWLAQHGRDFVGGDPYPPVKTVIPVVDESELWAVLEAATEAMDRKALPHAYISLAWNAGAEVITKRRHTAHPPKPTGGGVPDEITQEDALTMGDADWMNDDDPGIYAHGWNDCRLAMLASQQPPEQDTPE